MIVGFCLALAFCVFAAVRLTQWIVKRRKKAREKRLARRIAQLAEGARAVTPAEFFEMREKAFGDPGTPLYNEEKDFRGVYILFNEDKNKYYVGQGVRVLSRINTHFSGRGNGDVYADYKYLDRFTIKVIPLAGSDYATLNQLEKATIEYYDAFASGYNRTRGND